jgi:hypothetical protein
LVARVVTILLATLGVLLTTPALPAAASQDDEATNMLAVASAFNAARETCYASPDCPNLDEFMALFSDEPRRTEIQRGNTVVLLEGRDALASDHLRVASSFTGRTLETTAMSVHGRNVVMLQLNWDPGAPEPNPFTSVLRIEAGKIAHWVLVAP